MFIFLRNLINYAPNRREDGIIKQLVMTKNERDLADEKNGLSFNNDKIGLIKARSFWIIFLISIYLTKIKDKNNEKENH